MTFVSTAEIRAAACAKCGAPIGEKCRASSGRTKGKKLTLDHVARIDAAIRVKEGLRE